MAESMRFAQDLGYDLVLTCDYENLNTPINKTSEKLKETLTSIGIDAQYKQAGKKFTIVAHSMGGLVSRYFIERLGGNQIVSHLVMAGTPNGGSKLHTLKGAIDLGQTAVNYILNFATLGIYGLVKKGIKIANTLWGTAKGVSTVDDRGNKFSVTLDMMAPTSGFIAEINNPHNGLISQVRYSIIAGNNAEAKHEKSMLNKVGETFYGEEDNDIAVATDAILNVPTKLDNALQASVVTAHHLNYFDQEESRDALKKILA